MLFNPDASKPAQEVLVSRKKNVQIQIHLIISLNNIHVGRVSKTPRHLALDGKLIFNYFRLCYLENKKGTSVIKNLDIVLHRNPS